MEVVGGVNNERLSHFAARAGCITCLDFLFTRGADLLTKVREDVFRYFLK